MTNAADKVQRTSANGRAFIEAFEGLYLHTYDDGVGVLTIGYGHTTPAGAPIVVRGMTISSLEADKILSDDLGKVERNVSQCITANLTQPQFDALVSFDFNTGALKSGSVDEKINSGNMTAAMNTLLMYDHAGGHVMAGLTRRRQAERMMFMGQVDLAMKTAGAHAVLTGPPMPQKVDPPPKPSKPPVTQPPKQNALVAFLMTVLSIFKRKG